MKPTLIVICGATATGKTEVAFELAKKLKTEIISFDSIQVFKDLNLGSAKPSLTFREEVKHHLIDEIPPTETFTAGDFRKQANTILKSLKNQNYVVLVGGTGFYIQALLKGMYDIPQVPPELKKALEDELEQKGLASLYERLKAKDPHYALKIHPNDRYRILRALELIGSGSKTVSQIQEDFKSQECPYPVVQFGLHRKKEILREAIKTRTEYMLARGLVQEVRGLLEKYPGERIKPLESVGYKETLQFIQGKLLQTELNSAIEKSTLLLAKRQSTWFKRDKSIHWFDPDELGISGVLHHLEGALDNKR